MRPNIFGKNISWAMLQASRCSRRGRGAGLPLLSDAEFHCVEVAGHQPPIVKMHKLL